MRSNSSEGSPPAAIEASRVAFFGGSFDPPHLGHLAVARAARIALQLDTVLFAPVGTQPLKPQGATADFEDRVAMTRLAIATDSAFTLSLIDAPTPVDTSNFAPNFTIDTLHRLRAELPPISALFCLMGADSFLALRSWRSAAEIPFAAPLIVASRPGESLESLQSALPPALSIEPAKSASKIGGVEIRYFTITNSTGEQTPFYLLPGLDVEISASAIRRRIQSQLRAATGTRGLLPEAVTDYVRAHGLYR
jgi:nicotinate-nucleotide adenylyltransferase